VPDGHIDLQWIDGVLRIAGPDRAANLEILPPGATVIGFRFTPGSARAWLRLDASEIVNARVPLEAFWGSQARKLAEWAGEAATPEDIALRLETVLAARASQVKTRDGASRIVLCLLQRARPANAHIVTRLGDALAISERTLRRRCLESFGYGPNTLDRILRFQRFLGLARTVAPISLAALATDAGYADQAHLTREARHMAALTPSTILEQLRG
jgi:AraC-like DNA-binding protein